LAALYFTLLLVFKEREKGTALDRYHPEGKNFLTFT
jgi:hypothetical protein